MLDSRLMKHVDLLTERYPSLACVKQAVIDGCQVMTARPEITGTGNTVTTTYRRMKNFTQLSKNS